MIKVMIADDEALAIRRLEIKLTRYQDVNIIGTARDGEATLKAISKLEPDLVFLDINMPGMDGLDVAKHAHELGVKIIFITAFDQFAVQAFELKALDYLLKPVTRSRLEQALNCFRNSKKQAMALDEVKELNSVVAQLRAQKIMRTPPQVFDELWIKVRGRNRKINMELIEWIEASRDYVTLHMVDGHTHFVRDTMQHFVTILDASTFQRVHRSTIVNITKVKEVNTQSAVQHLLLNSGVLLRIGRAYKVITNLRLKGIFHNP